MKRIALCTFATAVLVGAIWLVIAARSTPAESAPSDRTPTAAPHTETSSRHQTPALPSSVQPQSADVDAIRQSDPRWRFQAKLEAASDQLHSADESRAIVNSALESTGPSNEPWTQDARTTFSGLGKELGTQLPSAGATVSEPRCFAAGCVVDVTYSSSEDHEVLTNKIVNSTSVLSWPGAKMTSPSVDKQGSRILSWVLIKP